MLVNFYCADSQRPCQNYNNTINHYGSNLNVSINLMFCMLHFPKSCKLNILFSFFFSFPFFWLELCSSRCCMCFKELSLFIWRRLSFFGMPKHTYKYIYTFISLSFPFLSKFFVRILNEFCSPIPIWFVFELQKMPGVKQKCGVHFCHGKDRHK